MNNYFVYLESNLTSMYSVINTYNKHLPDHTPKVKREDLTVEGRIVFNRIRHQNGDQFDGVVARLAPRGFQRP